MTAEEQIALLQKRNENTLDVLGAIAEGRSLTSLAHIKRVKTFSAILAQEVMDMYPEYGIDMHMVKMIANASSLHDIGKIAIADEILFKPARLTKEEFDIMKTHTIKGCEMLDVIENAWDEDYKRVSYEICRYHHEKFDGKGYPDGLKGDEIPISAQIVSVADVYDALVCDKVYKDAFSKEQAYHMILAGECGLYNPKLMDSLKKARVQYDAVADAIRNKGI